MEKSFEEWIDAFLEFVRSFGYHGPVNKETFIEDWESGQEPMQVARDFVNEINE